MKRVRILAVLLCAFALVLPLTGGLSASDAECPAYPSCADDTNCRFSESCIKKPGHGCGTCIGA